MKKKQIKLAVLINFLVLPLFSFAQLTVQETGKVEIGQEQAMSSVAPEKKDTVTTLKLYGTGINGANSRISFGNATSIDDLNVMIGELPGGDTDRLWLHGKKGLRFTTGNKADKTIFSYDMASGPFTFETNVAAPSFILMVTDTMSAQPRAMHATPNLLEGLNATSYCANGRTRYGFLLDEIKEVLPELVVRDKNGNYGIDYISCIPLLVNAVRELKSEIQELKGTERAKKVRMSGINTIETPNESVVAQLFQNSPNPFNSVTTIRFTLPESVMNANIYIYDLQGKQVMCLPVDERGASQVSINGSGLQPGMYIYTLIADNQEIDSKRMILTK